MKTAFVPLLGDSQDGHAHGGRQLRQPAFVSRRVQILATDHPATDRWITLTTTRGPDGSRLYVVGVVDGFSKPTHDPQEFPTLRRASNAANRLFNQLTKETGE